MPEETIILTEDGLHIPEEVREYGSQLVIRTPRCTIQHFGDNSKDPFYPLVDAGDFGPVDEFRDPKNPELAPDSVSFKPQGEPALKYTVDIQTDPSG